MRKLHEIIKDIQARLRELRGRFKIAHAAGLKALEAGDYKTAHTAIVVEQEIVDEQAALVKEQREMVDRLAK
jgi:hypothetical protein